MERLSVIGLGKLGLPMAACLAHRGHQVIGVDLNPALIQAVNEGITPIYEPGLADLIKNSQGRIKATDDFRYAIDNSEVTFVFVPTPSEEDGSFSTKYVEAASEGIAEALKSKDNFHLVVIRSTLLPGATEKVIKPIIENISGKKCGDEFGLCYNPEFLAVGSVIRDFLNPDMVIIGESESKSGKLLSQIYRGICQNNPPLVRTSIYNAELAKISLNAFITMKISFANIIAELCEQIPGGDVDVISTILGYDSRIGRKYLTGGLAYGGSCFPRDNKAFASFAKRVDCRAKIPEVVDEVNKDQISRVIHLVKRKLGKAENKKVAILGLSYKPDSDIVEPSASMEITRALLRAGARARVYDPAGMENARCTLGEGGVVYANSISECLTDTEFCILATPWQEFKNLKAEDFTSTMKKPVLLDCWRIFNRSEFSGKLEYMAIGLGPRN